MQNRRIHLKCAALAAAALTTAALNAQPVANHLQVLAQCGPNTLTPPPIGSSTTLTANGTCTTSQGGTGSVNAGAVDVTAMNGVLRVINSADATLVTHLFNPSGARAQGVADFAYPMNDVVFTSIANPSAVGPVQASANAVVSLAASMSGPADPISTTLPRSSNSIRVVLGSATVAGAFNVGPAGVTSSGVLVGYANDSSPLTVTTPVQTFTLTQPVTVQFIAQCYQTVLYNSVAPLPRTGSSDVDLRIAFPCNSPVFNLPPGITANSASLGIVNNVWVGGPCGPICDSIDFNNDGLFPDTLDVDEFVSVFGGGPCTTDPLPGCGDLDFNNDGLFPDTLDIESFLNVFGGGTCL